MTNVFGVESTVTTKEALAQQIGDEIGISRWFAVTQPMINTYADLIEDRQFIHVDPERAAAETPFGGTVAHGFLTLSLLPAMAYSALPVLEGLVRGVNYGFNRLRFLSPVKVGSRLRSHFTLLKLEELQPDEITMTLDATIEIEGEERPALIAEWMNRYYISSDQSSKKDS